MIMFKCSVDTMYFTVYYVYVLNQFYQVHKFSPIYCQIFFVKYWEYFKGSMCSDSEYILVLEFKY